jgi:type II secretory pathway component PulF
MELFLGAMIWVLVWLAPLAGLIVLGNHLMRLPLQRRERARAFLQLVDTTLKDGRNVEETLVSISQTRDPGLGPRFQALAALLRSGRRLDEALELVPGILPRQVVAMIKAGEKIGDLHKVIPACRQLLQDHLALTRGSLNYLLGAACVTTPAAILVLTLLQLVVLPKFGEIAASMDVVDPAGIRFLTAMRGPLIFIQFLLLLGVWFTAFVYIVGPAFSHSFERGIGSHLDRLLYRLPWRRRRMQRDFSCMLALLLDAQVPEAEALKLAADCTGNRVFRTRAALAAAGLARGLKLPEAVQMLDDSGEFRWRLALALGAGGGFFKAVEGWNVALEAQAAQEEQAAASTIAAGLVLLNGLFVGTIVVSVFSVLVAIVDQGVLW